MILFPAIDILDGKAVRLKRGNRDDATVYGTPIEMARAWRDGGAEWLHVVDLNGAFDGKPVNTELIGDAVRTSGIKVQVGGGIRTLDTMHRYFDCGVSRVILGTVIFDDTQILRDALRTFGSERIVCGIDAVNGEIAIRGWVETVRQTPSELGAELRDCGVRTVVYTDISRDGALAGLNVESCRALSDATGLDVVASGGLAGLGDIESCARADLYGAILGKALYEHKFTLGEALRCAREGAVC